MKYISYLLKIWHVYLIVLWIGKLQVNWNILIWKLVPINWSLPNADPLLTILDQMNINILPFQAISKTREKDEIVRSFRTMWGWGVPSAVQPEFYNILVLPLNKPLCIVGDFYQLWYYYGKSIFLRKSVLIAYPFFYFFFIFLGYIAYRNHFEDVSVF